MSRHVEWIFTLAMALVAFSISPAFAEQESSKTGPESQTQSVSTVMTLYRAHSESILGQPGGRAARRLAAQKLIAELERLANAMRFTEEEGRYLEAENAYCQLSDSDALRCEHFKSSDLLARSDFKYFVEKALDQSRCAARAENVQGSTYSEMACWANCAKFLSLAMSERTGLEKAMETPPLGSLMTDWFPLATNPRDAAYSAIRLDRYGDQIRDRIVIPYLSGKFAPGAD